MRKSKKPSARKSSSNKPATIGPAPENKDQVRSATTSIVGWSVLVRALIVLVWLTIFFIASVMIAVMFVAASFLALREQGLPSIQQILQFFIEHWGKASAFLAAILGGKFLYWRKVSAAKRANALRFRGKDDVESSHEGD